MVRLPCYACRLALTMVQGVRARRATSVLISRFAAGDAAPSQVGGAGDVEWVSGGDDQALFSAPQVQQVRALAAEQRPGVRGVVVAGVVAQVARGAVGFAAGQGTQAVEAAAGSDRYDAGPAWRSRS
jgi:hypothetical protein